MTDLTNSVQNMPVEQMQVLYKKYESVLVIFAKQEKDISYLAYIIDIAVNHIKTNHNDLTIDWKTWAVIVIKLEYFNNYITKEQDIIDTIDKFVIYLVSEYKKYCDSLAIIASEYDRDRGFVYEYLKTKKR